MKEKYLPIGTVLTLKQGTKKIMIVGYCPINDKNEMFDYTACPFPEGIITPNKIIAFNHENIETIHQMGIDDEETQKLSNAINEMVKNIETMKNIKIPAEENQTIQNTL